MKQQFEKIKFKMFDNSANDDMSELEALSEGLINIKFTYRVHPVYNAEVVKKLAYSPVGKWQFLYEKNDKRISCIRGYVSFGDYEIYCVKGNLFEDVERYKTAKETLDRIKELLV